jgi:broad-specificity NMP kinase
MQFIVFTGLPGTGKSSIAEAVALSAPLIQLTATNRMRYDVITFGP